MICCFRTSFPSLNILSCFRTSFPVLGCPFSVIERPFPVLECPFPVLEHPFSVLDRFFCFVLFFGEGDFVPGHPGTEEFVPGFLLLHYTWDKGTMVLGIIFVPGQWDNRTSHCRLDKATCTLN